MRTIIIWQSSTGPVLIDKEKGTRIVNCTQINIAPIMTDCVPEGTLFLWPIEVDGTVQHGLEPTPERVLIEFAPLFPSVVADGKLPTDYKSGPMLFEALDCKYDEFSDSDGHSRFGQPHDDSK